MNLKKIVMLSFTVVIFSLVSLYFWFWASPVGVNNYLNKFFFQIGLRSPETATYVGLVENTLLDFHSDKLDRYDRKSEAEFHNLVRKSREGLNAYGPENLTGQELLSWKIGAWLMDDMIRKMSFSHSSYRVNQIGGIMVNMPQFLTDVHRIIDEKSLERYISRLTEFSRIIDEVRVRVIDDRNNGVVPPDFVINGALKGMRSFVEGGIEKNPLFSSLPRRLEKLDKINEIRKQQLIEQAGDVVGSEIIPGYQDMIELFETLLPLTDHHAGIWRIPQGEQIYAARLQSSTTTSMSAEAIHQLGLSEVARIRTEMETILEAEGISEGTVTSRLRQLMDMPRYHFADSHEGRADQIAYLYNLEEKMMKMAPEFFITIPPQTLEIVRVPKYSQDGSAMGYYRAPAMDGSTPGRFYINQKDMSDTPRWTLPTLMYHEGAPGHHFQISASHLIKNLPMIRKMSPFTAYVEGWALYAEFIADNDMNIYKDDPLGNLGRLQDEMLRAIRLVVDTGMHAKRWSRERAIEYMLSNSGATEADATREVERYAVWPGQATAYKVGQLHILKLRLTAEKKLGDEFDLREFHEMLLMNGAMPLELLTESVNIWIASQVE